MVIAVRQKRPTQCVYSKILADYVHGPGRPYNQVLPRLCANDDVVLGSRILTRGRERSVGA